MRFAVVLLVAGVASVSANAGFDKRQNIPQCALTCIAQGPVGSCSQSDPACLCANSDFVSSVTQCIKTTCSPDDLSTANDFASQTCLQAGVPLPNTEGPSASGSASGPSASATGPSATGPSSTGPSSTGPKSTPSASGPASSPTPSSAAGQNGVSALAAFAAALGLSFFAL